MTEHPYRGLPDPQFWSRAVTWAPPGGVDPVVTTRFQVTPDGALALTRVPLHDAQVGAVAGARIWLYAPRESDAVSDLSCVHMRVVKPTNIW